MFKRKIVVSLEKDSSTKAIEAGPSQPELDLDQISKLIDEKVTYIAIASTIVVGGLIVLKTGCKIVENLSNPANWK